MKTVSDILDRDRSRLDPREAQAREAARVERRLGEVVLGFCASVGALGTFYLEDLAAFVKDATGHGSSESPSRILRLLRQHERLGYTCLSRSHSLYRIDWIAEAQGRLFR